MNEIIPFFDDFDEYGPFTFKRLMCPSIGPLLHFVATAAATAGKSRSRFFTNRFRATMPDWWALCLARKLAGAPLQDRAETQGQMAQPRKARTSSS